MPPPLPVKPTFFFSVIPIGVSDGGFRNPAQPLDRRTICKLRRKKD